MMIRGQFSDFFFETMLPALKAVADNTLRAKPKMYDKVLNVISTTRSIEQFSQMAGLGLATEVGEGSDTPVDNFVQGYDKTYKPVKYGLGVSCSQELVEDDKAGIISKRAARLADSIGQTIEIQAASVYNNAFDVTNHAGPDGVALCSASHPLVKAGGVQNNLLSVAADLDVTSLELALTDWETLKTHEGFYQMLPTPKVLVAPQNRWNVAEILKGQMRSDTANNTTNAFKYAETGAVVDFMVWSQLTDPDAWFLVAPASELEAMWVWRKQPYTKEDFDEKKETGTMYLRYRATYGFHGWRGIYGTPGA